MDGTLGVFMKQLLLKSTNTEPELPQKIVSKPASSYHVPILNDMNDYKAWNEKLAKKMNYLHKLYKRFIKKYHLKEPEFIEPERKATHVKEPSLCKNTVYSADIQKHLINYDESEAHTRFMHIDMAAIDAETLSIVKLFEEMNGQNPMRSKPDTEIQALNEPSEIQEDDENLASKAGETGEAEGDEEEAYNLAMHEIPVKCRADVILFL